jgi:hypothetical protein
MAAPVGNSNAKKGKEWFDALRKECVQRGALAKIAKVLVDKAEAGEQWAVQEVANRFDGKPAQAVELSGADGGPVESVSRIELVAMSGNGNSQG